MTTILVTEPVHDDGLNLLEKNGFTLVRKWEVSRRGISRTFPEY